MLLWAENEQLGKPRTLTIRATFQASSRDSSLSRDLAEMLLLRAADPNVAKNYETGYMARTTIVSLCQMPELFNERYSDQIIDILADILRLVFLSGADIMLGDWLGFLKREVRVGALVDMAAQGREVLVNVLDDKHLNYLERFLQNSLENASESEMTGILSSLSWLASRRPKSLQHPSRFAVIRAMSGRCLQNASKLGLPQTLEDYLLSMKD